MLLPSSVYLQTHQYLLAWCDLQILRSGRKSLCLVRQGSQSAGLVWAGSALSCALLGGRGAGPGRGALGAGTQGPALQASGAAAAGAAAQHPCAAAQHPCAAGHPPASRRGAGG